MPNVPGFGEVPWDQYNYYQNTGDTSHFSGPEPVVNEGGGASHSLAPNYAQILNQGTAYSGIGPSGQVGVGITAVPGGGGNGGGGGGGTDPYAQLLADNAARSAANDAAALAYQNAMLKYNNDQLALTAARDAWTKEYQSRSLDQQGALGVLGLGAQLKGPSNWSSYLRTLSNTPEGLRSAVNALSGKYGLSPQQASQPGAQYERQSVQTMVRDLNGAAVNPDAYAGADLPGGAQWNSRNFGILSQNPSQLGMLQGAYEDAGRDWNTEVANYMSSLPKYSGARSASVQLR